MPRSCSACTGGSPGRRLALCWRRPARLLPTWWSWPASLVLRTLALQAVLVLMTAIAARQSDAAIAAHQVAMRIWNVFVMALDAIAIAAQAIAGRQLGSGDADAARAATRRMIGWGA